MVAKIAIILGMRTGRGMSSSPEDGYNDSEFRM